MKIIGFIVGAGLLAAAGAHKLRLPRSMSPTTASTRCLRQPLSPVPIHRPRNRACQRRRHRAGGPGKYGDINHDGLLGGAGEEHFLWHARRYASPSRCAWFPAPAPCSRHRCRQVARRGRPWSIRRGRNSPSAPPVEASTLVGAAVLWSRSARAQTNLRISRQHRHEIRHRTALSCIRPGGRSHPTTSPITTSAAGSSSAVTSEAAGRPAPQPELLERRRAATPPAGRHEIAYNDISNNAISASPWISRLRLFITTSSRGNDIGHRLELLVARSSAERRPRSVPQFADRQPPASDPGSSPRSASAHRRQGKQLLRQRVELAPNSSNCGLVNFTGQTLTPRTATRARPPARPRPGRRRLRQRPGHHPPFAETPNCHGPEPIDSHPQGRRAS